MAELTNDFSWSVSRDQMFRSCQRAYYYHYYASWGGWSDDASEQTRKLYTLKNMKTLEMWAGSVVHETIAEALRRYAHDQSEIRTGELQARARSKLRKGWMEAVNREWIRQPKKNNLQELYYGNGKSLPKEKTDAVREIVYGSLQTFTESDVLQEILAAPQMSWKPVDQLDTFELNGTKVWCAIDFAFTDPAGRLTIIDWKTGKKESDAIREQLACYAYFACDKWQVSCENMRLLGVFLQHDPAPKWYNLTEADLFEAQNAILESAAAMRTKLADVENNTPQPESAFPTIDNERVCRKCKFREVCPQMNGAET